MGTGEYIRIAFHHLRMNTLRSLLTMTGIIIGIGSIISVVSIGEGGRMRIDKELERFGVNRLGIYAEKSGLPGQNPITLKDVEALKSTVKGVQTIAPIVYKSADVSYRNQGQTIDIIGTDQGISKIEEVGLIMGRFLNDFDVQNGRKVIVLSERTVENLFGNQSPLSRKVIFQNQAYLIIGVVKSSSLPIAENMMKEKAYIPITSFHNSFHTKWISEIGMKVFKSEDIEQVISQSVRILERRHYDKKIYKSYNLVKEMELARKIMNTFTLVIGSIAAISLIVGGIGVMNIMLVTVSERTQEIGIRKALGATDGQILGQFLMESLTISLFGGILGIGMGYALTFLASRFIHIPVMVFPGIVLTATLFSVGIGLFFGIYPAKKAADLNPIEALRYD